ncbi:CHAT domain-containing protein [Nocardia sp. JW2]|uniref:CHAT domain-containing protein n=1 Tax=Nocardia sp. JW2 TaxID=3450738 RepID=UPI003F43E979
MIGLVVDDGGFDVLVGDSRIGPRRVVETDDVELLDELTARYARLVHSRAEDGALLSVGRELFDWLDGPERQLSGLLDRAPAPLVFEVRGPRSPTESAWAMLRAPWELLAAAGTGFLAADELVRFSVVRRLGQAASGPEPCDFRLGLAFMASAPWGQHELDFEAEEAAILEAVGDGRVDLLVEDTGNPEQLGARLAEADEMTAVHVSCHGRNNWKSGDSGVPVLLLENDIGGPRPTTAGELIRLLPTMSPLMFVSACLTATGADAPASGIFEAGTGGGLVHSLVTALVTAGAPAVIGWDGSVGDRAATLFAKTLYRDVANGADLAVAVGDARRALLRETDSAAHPDWHMARVWLGPTGGGRLVTGRRKRSLVRATRGTEMFLDRKQQVRVADPRMFVGRRLELQAALRALRDGQRAGVLLHGQGRLGKSSLAARIADRYSDHAVAVVFGRYDAMTILDAVATAVHANRDARELIERESARVRHDPQAIGAVLIDLLAGPCAQTGPGQQPLLLIIDDLEQILEDDPDGPHRVSPAHATTLAAVLRAFDTSDTDSRVLITSRFTFTLGGVETRLAPVQLRSMSPVAQRKLHRRQQALTTEHCRTERAELAERAVAASRGNPGLQDLICRHIVYNENVFYTHAEDTVKGMETYLRQGDLPSDAEVRTFLENLALDTLMNEAGPANLALLRAANLFDLPIPESVIGILTDQLGGSPTRLSGLGLLEPQRDPYNPDLVATRVNPLVVGRLEPLTDKERTSVAAAIVRVLYATWGGEYPALPRDRALDLQLTRLAVAAEDPTVVSACAARAVMRLSDGPAEDAAALGNTAIALLDRHETRIPLLLLRRTAEAALTSGAADIGESLLDRALHTTDESAGLEPARALATRADLHLRTGNLSDAEQLWKRAQRLFTDGGSELEATTVTARLADLAEARGEYDEAERILRNDTLPVFKRLGDIREVAVVWGKLANLTERRGEYDEAERILRNDTLPVFKRLGEVYSIAVIWGKLADLAQQRGEYDKAERILRNDTLPVFKRLGDIREVAITRAKLANLAEARGEYDEAERILRNDTLPVLKRLGDIRSIAVTWGRLADLAQRRGELDEAERILRNDTLPVLKRLGDVHSIAVTWGRLADLAQQRGEHDEAEQIRRENELPVYEHLGDTRSAAITWGQLADLAQLRGEFDEAERIRRENELPVYEHLGDTRSAAITWGKQADIARLRGEYDLAVRLRNQQLEAETKLSNPEGIATARWGLVQIAIARQDHDSVLGNLAEAFRSLRDLENADGIAVVGKTFGEVLVAVGQPDLAQDVLAASLSAAHKIGDNELIASVQQLLDRANGNEEE